MRIADLPLTGVFFDRDGKPNRMGLLLLNVVNQIKSRTGGILGESLGPLPEYTVLTLPDAATNAKGLIYVSDETGGATIAFSDGAAWRRVQDRNVVS